MRPAPHHRLKLHYNKIVLSAFFASVIATVSPASADEGGVPFWFSGSYASLAAVPATPGWSLASMGYYYYGDASASRTFTRGDSVTLGVKSTAPLLLAQPSYAPEQKFLGGQASIGIGIGYGNNDTKADVSLNPAGIEFGRSDSLWGGTDLYPVVSLAWNNGVHNWMSYLTGDIPVGAYSDGRLSNIGIGHAAVDAGGAYTYFDEKSGREYSATVGFTYNWENSDTDYQNGIDSHLDWAASQFLSANWQVGIVGYVYYQLTGDSDSGDRVGSFKSRVAAVGPEVGYVFEFNGQQAYANVRGYYEFWAKNRVEGYALFGTLSVPLGKRSAR